MKYVKYGAAGVAGLVVLLLVAIGVVFAASPSLRAFPYLPSAYDAKQTCSCRFVEHRDAAFCEDFVAQDVVPIQGRSVDEQARTADVTALWITTRARWVSDREGCRIE